MTRDPRRESAWAASGIFAMLSALLVLFTVAVAFVVTQPSFSDTPLITHTA
jgi:hypothetical protein